MIAVRLLLLAASAEALVVPRYGNVNPAVLFRRDDDLDSSLCMPACDLGTCGSGGSCSLSSISKRDWFDESLFSYNASSYDGDVRALSKRLFTYTAGSTDVSAYPGKKLPKRKEVDAYLPAVFDGGESAYFGDPLPTVAIAGDAVSDERAVSQQVEFGDQPFQIISARMHGCTTIVIASTRAVWMTHLWESYSNGKDENGDNLVGAGDAAFNQRVLMFLRGETVTNPLPNGYKDYIAPSGPAIDASLFNIKATDQTTIYIYTPVKYGTAKGDMTKSSSLKYEARYGANGEVRNTIADIFGDTRPRITIVPYMPLNTANPTEAAQFGTDARGTVLFQYDPDSDGTGNGKKAWRVFIEARMDLKNL